MEKCCSRITGSYPGSYYWSLFATTDFLIRNLFTKHVNSGTEVQVVLEPKEKIRKGITDGYKEEYSIEPSKKTTDYLVNRKIWEKTKHYKKFF